MQVDGTGAGQGPSRSPKALGGGLNSARGGACPHVD